MEENEQVLHDGGRPATGRPVLLGITKASLSTESTEEELELEREMEYFVEPEEGVLPRGVEPAE